MEAQQADREAREKPAEAVSAADAALVARRRVLELARTRAIADLSSARSPAHRRMLEAAIQSLDEQLRDLPNRKMD